jgi:hypothetical protein
MQAIAMTQYRRYPYIALTLLLLFSVLSLPSRGALAQDKEPPQPVPTEEPAPQQPPGTPEQGPRPQANREPSWVAPRGGTPFFVIGANYEGPVDQAWMMWEDGKFAPDRIAADFDRARSIGINTLRVFVQKPLRDDINAGDFSKLDTAVRLARDRNLWLLLTFTDWPEPDLSKAADLNRRIAEHLAAEPGILAYDVKNEPQVTDIAGAIFPAGVTVPLQARDALASYGERVPCATIGDYRRKSNVIPGRMNDEQACTMANYYELFRDFLSAGTDWVRSHGNTTTLDYMDSPDSARWAPLLAAVDATLLAWNKVQIDPVRAADPGRPVTVGYSNVVLAKLPGNREMTFQSVHRFTAHGFGGLNATFLVLDNLKRTFHPQPVMLEEFGYPGQTRSGGSLVGFDPRTTANLEAAVWSYLYANGYAGGAKWMLNNFPQGYDPAQNTYGLFDNDGRPKIQALALREFASITSSTGPGEFTGPRPDDNQATSYAYAHREALIAGGKTYSGANVSYTASAASSFFMATDKGAVRMFATDNATATLNLPGIFGVPTDQASRVVLTGLDAAGQPWEPPLPVLDGDTLVVSLKALHAYRVRVIPAAFEPAEPQPGATAIYFPQTRHNLGGEFLAYWQANGGLSVYGYPISEPFSERGYVVQYFERNRFELHPENQPPYNVLLGRLGADEVNGRRFEPSPPFESMPDRRYFPETGHSLANAFLGYWERHGGLAQFGYPISEEIKEVSATDGKSYTVQYFERGRFEYHPENKGSDAEVLLGLLGVGAAQRKGWMP